MNTVVSRSLQVKKIKSIKNTDFKKIYKYNFILSILMWIHIWNIIWIRYHLPMINQIINTIKKRVRRYFWTILPQHSQHFIYLWKPSLRSLRSTCALVFCTIGHVEAREVEASVTIKANSWEIMWMQAIVDYEYIISSCKRLWNKR